MYEIGNDEVKAIKKIISQGKLFRYFENSECSIFEKNYSKYLSVKHTALASSGTTSLTAALVGLTIGPGDEVLVPAHTYMATAMSVLSVGAIPIIVDIKCPENIHIVIEEAPIAFKIFLSRPINQFLLQPSQREAKSEYISTLISFVPMANLNL